MNEDERHLSDKNGDGRTLGLKVLRMYKSKKCVYQNGK